MQRYAGRDPTDPPKGGGGFPRTQGYCGEELNFVPCDDGYVYGHFETIKKDIDRSVAIERLGASPSEGYVDGIDIVWTAPVEGNDPRCVVGWYRDARLYRERQLFRGIYPSEQHEIDEITSFRVRAKVKDAFILRPKDRTEELMLGRGPGWSGQASWWYAEDTANAEARRFVSSIKSLVDGHKPSPAVTPRPSRGKTRAGAAAESSYVRYVKAHEAVVGPRHNELHKRFMTYLRRTYPGVSFPPTVFDDLRYLDGKESPVMVEIKPCEAGSERFAIRTAIGQLFDYAQHQRWEGRKLIVIETPAISADDRALALKNGFGLAWPIGPNDFTVIWPK